MTEPGGRRECCEDLMSREWLPEVDFTLVIPDLSVIEHVYTVCTTYYIRRYNLLSSPQSCGGNLALQVLTIVRKIVRFQVG